MKVLIVDDDYLVRKGIVSLMPWQDYGLEIVGEAENGKKALQFLQSHAVDLVVADIAMPTMNGLELLREIRAHYRHIWVVMLTFHQDFEYVQDALRLGAIDYIAKVELEQENMSEVLQRITTRIQASIEERHPIALETQPQPDTAATRVCLVYAGTEQAALSWLQPLLSPAQYEQMHELERGAWLLPALSAKQEETLLLRMQGNSPLIDNWCMIKVEGWTADRPGKCLKMVSDYLQRGWMYDYTRARVSYVLDCRDTTDVGIGDDPKLLLALKQEWESLDWLYQESRFEELLHRLHAARMTAQALTALFYAVISTWERLLGRKLEQLFPDEHCRFWLHWETWLREIRQRLAKELAPASYSADVLSGVMRSVDYIHAHLDLELKLADVAARVHISRSYFSECFKQIMGKPFNDYIREARIALASSLLVHTQEPIYKIAEKCGYPDEKYFSRIFRQKNGHLPSEYRKHHSRG